MLCCALPHTHHTILNQAGLIHLLRQGHRRGSGGLLAPRQGKCEACGVAAKMWLPASRRCPVPRHVKKTQCIPVQLLYRATVAQQANGCNNHRSLYAHNASMHGAGRRAHRAQSPCHLGGSRPAACRQSSKTGRPPGWRCTLCQTRRRTRWTEHKPLLRLAAGARRRCCCQGKQLRPVPEQRRRGGRCSQCRR